MTWVATAVAGTSLVTGYLGNQAQADAADKASAAQLGAARMGVDEQRRQFDAIQKLMAPYVQSGTAALGGYGDLLGINGADKQQLAINGITAGPAFQSMSQQGQNAILSNASATGGLRGGNVQAALGQFQPNLLSQLIQQQMSGLGGLAGMGQSAAANQGAAGLSTGNNITQLLSQQGAASAGNYLTQGKLAAQQMNDIGSTLGTWFSNPNVQKTVF